jgi:diguanylate cyclase (GGDEF)-like protein
VIQVLRSPQIVRRHRHDGASEQPLTGGVGGSGDFDLLATTELDMLVRGLARTVGAQAGLLALSDGTGEVEVLSTWGDVMGLEGFPTSLTDRFLGRAFASERAVLEPLGANGDGALAASGRAITHAATAAVQAATGELAGAVCALFAAAPTGEHGETLRMVESYARLASLCLTEPRVFEELLATAKLDGLTGCLNYAAIGHALKREIRRSERHGLSLSCCFVDLDDFKLVNDRYGHLHGSSVLVEVAEILQAAMRSEDTLGRYGGDEFVAILPETDESEGVTLAQRVRSVLSTPAGRPARGHVDVSIGVAQWQSGSSAADVLEAADLALRAAKQSGGGTVIGASELGQSPEDRRIPGANVDEARGRNGAARRGGGGRPGRPGTGARDGPGSG